MAIRSGRFTVDNAQSGITIIKGRSGAFYRIFNSGENNFTVKPKGASTPQHQQIQLKPTFSIDVAIGDEVVIVGAANEAVEGIYDYLDTQNPIRSGRFKLKDNPDTQHKIVDLHGGGDKAWYRIFNSGEHPIVVEEGKQNPSQLTQLDKEQSFDFEVGTSVTDIYVKSTDANKPIEGIYEFLGRGD
jgi:hypothetical protein